VPKDRYVSLPFPHRSLQRSRLSRSKPNPTLSSPQNNNSSWINSSLSLRTTRRIRLQDCLGSSGRRFRRGRSLSLTSFLLLQLHRHRQLLRRVQRGREWEWELLLLLDTTSALSLSLSYHCLKANGLTEKRTSEGEECSRDKGPVCERRNVAMGKVERREEFDTV